MHYIFTYRFLLRNASPIFHFLRLFFSPNLFCSVYFFPRVTLLYFLGFHFYFYTVPYGYFDCALIPLFFLMVHAMIYSLLAFEIPAARRGAVSLECPREVYSRVSWPEWTASLPQEWTLFLPLNSRYVPLHDRDVESTTSRTAGREQS
jgi:hypothetical protein